jgi:hypothetical protein
VRFTREEEFGQQSGLARFYYIYLLVVFYLLMAYCSPMNLFTLRSQFLYLYVLLNFLVKINPFVS